MAFLVGLAGEHASPRAGGLNREQTDERRKNDQDLKHANLPHLGTSFENRESWTVGCSHGDKRQALRSRYAL